MRHLMTLTTLWFSGWALAACTSHADVASKNNPQEVGGATQGGSTSMGQGGSAATSTGGNSSTIEVSVDRSQLSVVTTPDISDSEYAAFISDSNAFGLELLQKLNADQGLTTKNGVFSPTSAQLALAMTYGAAVGDTATAMKATLHDNLGATKYHAGCNRLQRDLASRNYNVTDSNGYTRRIELAPANSLWTDRTMSIKTAFLDLLGQQYDTGMWRVDFMGQPDPARLAINAWVMDRTHDRIQDLLQAGDVSIDTRFVLVNALYFYGTWLNIFDKAATQPSVFHTLAGTDVDASTMHETKSLQYKAASNFEVLQLPYVTNNLRMTLVLPSSGQFETVRAQLSSQWLSDATTGLASNYVQLSLPKFKITTPQLMLAESLKSLGMSIAFSDSADFTGMTDESLYISKVIQKAFIGIDEDGTEAAAATAVIGEYASLPPTPIPMVFDRPFLFFIQDKTGLVLFAGQVVDPTI
jgi:serpin B